MTVAGTSAPQRLAAGHVADGCGTGTLKSSNGHVANGSPYHSGHFDFGSGHLDGHYGVELRCSKCSSLPVDCHCVESHPVGPAYCPNPNDPGLPREFETHVQIFVRVPEMQEVEETHYRKDVKWTDGTQKVPKSVVEYVDVELFEMVPVVKLVPKTRQEIEYIVCEEDEIEITVIEQRVVWENVCVIRQKPRVITEEVEETIKVPVVKEVKVTKMCEEWTGKYCESEVEKFCTSGDFNLICDSEDSCHQHSSGHVGIRKLSSASTVSGGDSPSHHQKPRRIQSMMGIFGVWWRFAFASSEAQEDSVNDGERFQAGLSRRQTDQHVCSSVSSSVMSVREEVTSDKALVRPSSKYSSIFEYTRAYFREYS